MTGIRYNSFKNLGEFQRYKLIQCSENLIKEEVHDEFIIKEIFSENHRFIAPKPKLKGVTFGQFIFADTWFTEYRATSEKNNLYRFISSWYPEENTTFSEEQTEQNIHFFEKQHAPLLDAVVVNYELIREWLSRVYPLVFIKEENNSLPKNKHNMWIKIFEGLVGDDIVNHNRYTELPVHNVFRFMTNKIKESMRRKK